AKAGNFLVHRVVPGDVRDQVLDHGECLHRQDRDRLVVGESVHAGLAGETRFAVYFRRARSAPSGFAVPAHGEIGRLVLLHIMEGVEHHHAGGYRHLVVHRLPALAVAAEDSQDHVRHYATAPFSTFRIACNSSGMSEIGSCRRTISCPLRTMMLCCLPHCSSYLGKSSRLCAPRLSQRASALRVTAAQTVSMDFRSAHRCQPGLNIRDPLMLNLQARSCSRSRSSNPFFRSCSVRKMPTSVCMVCCRSACTAYGLSPPWRSKGASASRSASSICP